MKRSHIELCVERPPLPKIACVPTQISQVMLNLLVNAIQAVEERPDRTGGRLTVKIDSAPGGGQMFEVSDNGVGIPPEEVDRIFDPFYTTKPVGEGTGLGLAITHGIVTGHCGTIQVDSRAGQGTTFRVTLPARG